MIAPESRSRVRPPTGIAPTVTLDVPEGRPEPAPPERASASAASTAGTFLYGFVEGGADAVLGVVGVDGRSPARIVAGDGLACVVSEHRGDDLRALSKEALVRGVLAHQRVIESVMGERAVLPAKFGTLLADGAEVGVLLAQARGELMQALAGVQGKVEIEVAATWDLGRVLQDLAGDDAVRRAREAITEQGRPTTLGDQIALGRLVQARADARRVRYREAILEHLRPIAADIAVNALVSDAMVANLAFLVERARQAEFEAAVERLDEFLGRELTFRVIGPLPPYSFSTVEVTRLTPERLAAARQALRLGVITDEGAVRRAYRRLAAENHRGLGPGEEPAPARLRELRRAHDLLLGYCRAREGRSAAAWLEGSGDGLFVVAIRGSGADQIEPTRFGASVEVVGG